MNIQQREVCLAILFLAIIGGSNGQDMSTSFGFPHSRDSIFTQHIHMDAKPLRSVSHTTGFSVDRTINAVKFKDIWKTGAKIELKGHPPFTNLEVKFTSIVNKGYYFIMDVYYTDTHDNVTETRFICFLICLVFIIILLRSF